MFTRRLDWNGAFSTPFGGMQLENAPDARIVTTGFDFDRETGSHYALTYRSTVIDNVYLVMLGYRGHGLGETLVFDAVGNDASLGGAVTFDEDSQQFLLGYSYNIPGLGLERIVPYVHPTAPAVSTSGIGCGSGQLSWLGSQLIGDGSVSVRMSNAPIGGITTVLFATATASAPLFGFPPVVDGAGCWCRPVAPTTSAWSTRSWARPRPGRSHYRRTWRRSRCDCKACTSMRPTPRC